MSIETLLSSVGVLLGLVYVVGGLIVNLHLSQYGLTSYQVLRVKYLAVGLTFLLNFASIIFLSAIGAVLILVASETIQQIALIASLLVSIWLLRLWAGISNAANPTWMSWLIWLALGTISIIFPLSWIVRLVLGIQINFASFLVAAEALLAGIMSFVAQLYFYARRLYGHPNAILGAIDPIGMGIPVQVQLAGDLTLLANLGLPILQDGISNKILLIDETDTHYIVGITLDKGIHAIEVNKDLIKAILYNKGTV
jgi:hypothetical protein